MKTVLCFGDSNTWGFDPESFHDIFPRRHPPEVRWTGVLAHELGADWRVIEEGQNGRTTVHEDPFTAHRNGKIYLPACLESHKPIDFVVVMLGTNDLKSVHNLPPGEIANGAAVLARMILTSTAGPNNRPPRLLLLPPPRAIHVPELPDLAEKIPDAEARSTRLPAYYQALAKSLGAAFLNTQDIVQPSPIDGLHLDAAAHAALGAAIAAKLRTL